MPELPPEGFDPFRTPAWRWELAGEVLESRRKRRRMDDPALNAAVAFRARVANASRYRRRGLARQDAQALADAYGMFQAGGPRRWELEARLVAGQTDEEVAKVCDIPAEVISWYERVFFDVRSSLHATDYLILRVVGAGPHRGFQEGELGNFWAWAAMGGGPLILDTLIATFRNVHQPGEPARLGIYLSPGVDPGIQAFVGVSVFPPFGPTADMLMQLHARLIEAEAAHDRDRAAAVREGVQNDLIRCAQAYLAAERLPRLRRKTRKQTDPQSEKAFHRQMVSPAALRAALMGVGAR